MKGTGMRYAAAAYALLALLVLAVPAAAQARPVPEGFVGVPWGAGADQIVKAMKEQGYRQLKATPTSLVFRGAFAGYPCDLTYIMPFASGWANYCGRSGNAGVARLAYDNIIAALTRKYGPPDSHASVPDKTDDGRALPDERTFWNFVDEKTSDKYSIMVNYHVTWFADTDGDQYVVDVAYSAESLYDRLKAGNL